MGRSLDETGNVWIMGCPSLAIVGMRRSGTSLLSSMLNQLGVSFGEPANLFGGDSHNKEGYWEHKTLTRIHRQFRMSLNLGSIDCDPTPEDWLERPASGHLIEQGIKCLNQYFLGLPEPWAWKDPDASLALPFVYEASRLVGIKPHLVLCVRDPSDVAASEKHRMGSSELETVGSWLAHTIEALRTSHFHPRTVILFSDLIADPFVALSPLLKQIGLVPSEEQWRKASETVQQDLIHNRSEPGEETRYPILVSQVYELSRSLAAGTEPVVGLEACYPEYDRSRRMFDRPPIEMASLSARWTKLGKQETAEIQYRPQKGWQTVSLDMGATGSCSVEIYIYPLPANIWIRSARWSAGNQTFPAEPLAGRAGVLRQKFGLTYVAILHGPDQLIFHTPASEGPFTLELEFMVETNALIVGDTFRVLSDISRRS